MSAALAGQLGQDWSAVLDGGPTAPEWNLHRKDSMTVCVCRRVGSAQVFVICSYSEIIVAVNRDVDGTDGAIVLPGGQRVRIRQLLTPVTPILEKLVAWPVTPEELAQAVRAALRVQLRYAQDVEKAVSACVGDVK